MVAPRGKQHQNPLSIINVGDKIRVFSDVHDAGKSHELKLSYERFFC
ncbi:MULTISPECIES: hypothetical protein [unclassified Photorhabdus]|nr:MULTISPECIES: hypothetical protein [unclassified Photorhabdus]